MTQVKRSFRQKCRDWSERHQHSVQALAVTYLMNVDATAFIMIFMFALGIAADLDGNNVILRYIQGRSGITPKMWEYIFFACGATLAIIRPGVSFFGMLLISPIFVLLYFIIQMLLGATTSGPIFLLVLLVFTMLQLLLFYLRSAVVKYLLEMVVDLRKEIQSLQATKEGPANADGGGT